eukprot:TRINITY_DN4_c0_g1_i3.p1 TRINITY_DN4_c0_g1~~TRINITY_DN4_c0_g1_i3.p1  ORF type:complete len:587 (-),score=294.74 TRINITY_DN4_c0_g1_i3:128-1846(-)
MNKILTNCVLICFLYICCFNAIQINNNGNNEIRVRLEFEKDAPIPIGWTISNRNPNPNTLITLTLALKQSNKEKLEEIFWQVSDPNSEFYGKFLSHSEAMNLIRPSIETRTIVKQWLINNHISIDNNAQNYKETIGNDFIIIKLKLIEAENLLACKFNEYTHITTGNKLLRTIGYSVPISIAEALDFIGGTIRFPRFKKATIIQQQLNNNNNNNDDDQIVGSKAIKVEPSIIKSRYNISAQDVGKATNNNQAVHQFLEQYYSPSDLSKFFKEFNLPDNAVDVLIGPNDASKPGAEASLDIEYIMATATDVSSWFYSTATNGNEDPFLDWITTLTNMTNSPLVNSVSYGEEEHYASSTYLDRCDTQFQLFGSQGRSLLFASGDSGVGCRFCNSFAPDWPASSPYVTAVGGTYLDGNDEIGVEFSGGGFSDHFTRPSYQQTVVSNYLKNTKNLPNKSFYNSANRGYPDVSGVATNYEIVVRGFNTVVNGTSCSTPMVAGIIALLNDIRLQKNQSQLGFLNPWLYQIAASNTNAFYDVIEGRNSYTCCTGFPATYGWDPMTGLGTPNFAVLKKLV